MRIRFWGVRGSTPTPQQDYLGYGGNTSCVEIRTDDNDIIILDGGTGIRLLGKALEQEFGGSPIRAHVFCSHFHFDHIQGIPFFTPLYSAKNIFTFYSAGRHNTNQMLDALAGMMANPYFPVDISHLPSKREHVDLAEGTFHVNGTEILVLRLNHPQGCVGYRLTQNGKVVTYCTDVEHGVDWSDRNLQTLARDADLFIVDAQYTPEEYPRHRGWGHSTWRQAVASGTAAGAKQILLFHHDPYHEDSMIETIVAESKGLDENVIAAREGAEFEL